MIDVNGAKKPNIAGKDIFAISFYIKTKKMLPFSTSAYGGCVPASVGVVTYGANLVGLGCSQYYLIH